MRGCGEVILVDRVHASKEGGWMVVIGAWWGRGGGSDSAVQEGRRRELCAGGREGW